jgi:hypothetical protein
MKSRQEPFYVRHVLLGAMCALVFLMIPLNAMAKAWFPFDMAVTDFWVSDEKGFQSRSSVTVPEGTVLEIHCAWSVKPTEYVEVKKKLMWRNEIDVDKHARGLFPIEVPPQAYGFTSYDTGIIGQNHHALNGVKELDGEFHTGWKAYGPGPHTLSCMLDSDNVNLDLEKIRANNSRELVVTVSKKAKPSTLRKKTGAEFAAEKPTNRTLMQSNQEHFVVGQKGGMIGSSSIHAALPEPSLAVTSVVPQVQTQNCQSPQPALIAVVTIKNSGAPLATDQGSVYVKEFGGGNLGSGGIQLPAIGSGQTKMVNIPAITMRPYASLAGSHQLQVIFSPVLAGGKYSFKKPNPYSFSATFPPGYCSSGGTRRPMGPSGLQPVNPKLNPQPEPPAPRMSLPSR